MGKEKNDDCLIKEFTEQITELVPEAAREEVKALIKQFSTDIYDAGFCDGIELGKEKGYRDAAEDFRSVMVSAELMKKPVGIMH